MPTTSATSEAKTLLDNVRWQTYEALLEDAGEAHLRFTYDNGTLEIMTLSFAHENPVTLLGRLLETLTEELNIPIRSGGSLTLKKESTRKGLEADECYWIENEKAMRGKTEFDIESDPPPDLAIEVDVSTSSLDRLSIYASLGVGEVRRYDGEEFTFHRLIEEQYQESEQSGIFPRLPKAEILRFLKERGSTDETTLCRNFRQWVRDHLLSPTKKSRKGVKKKKPEN